MQVTVTLTANNEAESQRLYTSLAIISSALSGDIDSTERTPSMKLPGAGQVEGGSKKEKRAPKSKTKITLVDDEADDDDDDDMLDSASAAVDMDDDDDEDDDDGEIVAPVRQGATSKPGKSTKTSKLTLEGDIIPAMASYAKKYDREKAAKLLKKFGAKNVRAVPADKYPELLAAARA